MKMNLILPLLAVLAFGVVGEAAAAEPGAPQDGNAPAPAALSQWLGSIPARFEKWDVVAEPDKDEAEWWAGAPSVVREDSGTFWMAARMRTADAPLGRRGYEIRT